MKDHLAKLISDTPTTELERTVAGCYKLEDSIYTYRQKWIDDFTKELDHRIKTESLRELQTREDKTEFKEAV
jgi:hypothetical protein